MHFFLQTVAENDRDKISIILAGYEDDMNNKLFSFNEGKIVQGFKGQNFTWEITKCW
jgi:hypothetical protein